jgi:hypothetical protein
MNELPSLNFPSPIGRGSRVRWGKGGKGRGHYTALQLNDMDMDEIPLMSDEMGVVSDEDEEEVELKEEVEGVMWQGLGGRKKWQRRIRSHTTLLGLIFGGGWQVVLAK